MTTSNNFDLYPQDLYIDERFDNIDAELDIAATPLIAICHMAAPTTLEYDPSHASEAASWDISPASVLTVGVGIWTAATGAAVYFAMG